jgi:hypothetical protein
MRKLLILSAIILLIFLVFQSGCTIFPSAAKDEITVKDSLDLKGSCIITGIVTDGSTNEPIRGANVVVYSRPKQSVTDLYGQFDLIDLPEGTYTLQVFCVGYDQKTINNVEVRPDRMIRLEIKLERRNIRQE